MSNEIQELFEKLLQEKTFTADALDGIQELRKKAEEVERKNQSLMKELSDTNTRYGVTLNEVFELRTENKAFKTRLDNIQEREFKSDLQEVKLQAEKEKQALVLDMFKTVFKPSSIREVVARSIPIAVEGMNPNPSNTFGSPGHVETHTSTESRDISHE